MECPDINRLQAFSEGGIAAAEREAICDHADACDDCRRAIAALVHARVPELEATLIRRPEGEAADRSALEPGGLIGRYRIESTLGAGALGVVYAAHDPELGRRIAIKVLKAGIGGDVNKAHARMVREAQVMAKVSHPNVLGVLDVGRWEDRVFIAMELVDGTDLRRWLKEAPRSIEAIVDVFRAAGRGLAVAHAAGIVHRDFKPENVLIGRDGRVRVADFGLARQVEDADEPFGQEDRSGDELLTATGTILGTPAYMAPEQHGAGNVDSRSDQFAFSVALYEALFKERPFRGGDVAALRHAVLSGAPPKIPRASNVPRALREIVLRGLRTRPGERWQNMDALLEALSRDRTRLARYTILTALAALAVIATAALGDWVIRARLHAAARASFAVTGEVVGRNLLREYEAFNTLAELSMQVPIMREVAATRDQSEFGLGSAEDDRQQLERLHASLRDADWRAWSLTTRRGAIAVADAKARLLYSSGSAAFATDVLALRAAEEAYRRGGSGRGAQVLRADDPGLIASGVVSAPRSGLVVLFARASILAGVPQALFIQTIDGQKFLEATVPHMEAKVALVARDGTIDGDLAKALVDAALASPDAMIEASEDREPWLVQAHALPGLEPDTAPIATVVIGRKAVVGLAGLFAGARLVLGVASIAAALAIAAAALHIRRNSVR